MAVDGQRRERSRREGQGFSRWCLMPAADVVWRHWEGAYVIHDALSNDTHQVSECAGRVLATLQASGALELDSLAEQCGAERDDVAETLAALEELDLVARC